MAKLAEKVRARMVAARESLAADMLAWEKVRAVIDDAANGGEDRVTIRPPKPVSLKGTKAGEDALAAIRLQGFKAEWEMMRDRPTDPEVPVVVVSW